MQFCTKNPVEERYRLLLHDLDGLNDWIITGAMDTWCQPFLPLFQLVIFLYAPREVRVTRLLKREYERFGDRILPGGDMEQDHKEFVEWAGQYDEGYMTGRSLERHEKWMKTISCPILRIDGEQSVEKSVEKILTSNIVNIAPLKVI